jgi:asparagine synthase (glutamine-hydrolysing)
MCGINGVYAFSGLNLKTEVIHKMNQQMIHRGPDSDGVYEDSHVLLGHRRLSIIDVGNISDQPFNDNSGRYVMVFNG